MLSSNKTLEEDDFCFFADLSPENHPLLRKHKIEKLFSILKLERNLGG